MSMFSKLAKLASSPQGKAAVAKARAAADDPKNRAKIDELVGKVKAKGGRPASDPAAPSTRPASAPTAGAPVPPPTAAPATPPATGTTSAEQVHPPRP